MCEEDERDENSVGFVVAVMLGPSRRGGGPNRPKFVIQHTSGGVSTVERAVCRLLYSC